MRGRLAVLILSAVASCGVRAGAQPAAGMPGKDTGAATPPEKLPTPLPMSGIGNGLIAITTSSAEARMWFTQGLNLLHDFWDYESARAFEQSVRLDPKCAMCFWGALPGGVDVRYGRRPSGRPLSQAGARGSLLG